MRKFIVAAGLAAGLMICGLMSHAAQTIKADIESVRIPRGTTLKLQMIDAVSSKTGAVGDEFNAMLLNDQVVNSKIALPSGSIFRGTITKIIPSKRLSRSAIVYVSFDHVVSPTGRQVPVSAGLFNYPEITIDGGIYQGGNYGYAIQQNWAKTKDITSKAINWGKGTGENMQYVCTPLGALGGAIGGGAYFVGDSVIDLFRNGNAVNIPQGKQIDVMTTQPIDLPLH